MSDFNESIDPLAFPDGTPHPTVITAATTLTTYYPIYYFVAPAASTYDIIIPNFSLWPNKRLRLVCVGKAGSGSVTIKDPYGNTITSGLAEVGDHSDCQNYGGVTVEDLGTSDSRFDDPAVAGTVEAGKRVVVDSNKDISRFGTLSAETVNVYTAMSVRNPSGNSVVTYENLNIASGTVTNRTQNTGSNAILYTRDPGAANQSMAFGEILGFMTEARVFNGDSTGATSETTILTGVLAAGFARPGGRIDVDLALNATAFNGADTLTIKVKVGSTVISSVALVAADVGVVVATMTEIYQALGASGKSSYTSEITAAVTTDFDFGNRTPDTTASLVYTVTAQWSSNNAGNTATFIGGRVQYS